MIIWMFLVWLVLGVVLLFLGFWTDDQSVQVLAWIILWIPAYVLSGINAPLVNDTPGVQYPDGENTTLSFNETYVYGDNYTGYHWDYVSPSPSVNDVNLFHRSRTEDSSTVINYSTYENRIYGILLLFVFVFGMVFSLGEIRGTKESDGPPSVNWRRYWKWR